MNKTFLLTTAVAVIALTSSAFANEGTALSQQKKTIDEHRAYQYEFERDEACQGYAFGVKRLGIKDACGEKAEPVVEEPVVEEVVFEEPVKVLSEYVVYFDTNSFDVPDSERGTLTQAAQEIRTYNPGDVLVAGYTDTKGSEDYNQELSAKRAKTVSQILSVLGVDNNVVNMNALGETELAVPTEDNVDMRENRRVVVQFVK